MVIIFELGNRFWIDAIDRPRVAVAATGQSALTINLTKAGIFLACSFSMDETTVSVADSANLAHFLQRSDNNHLEVGQLITNFNSVLMNANAQSETFGGHILFFMRGSGS